MANNQSYFPARPYPHVAYKCWNCCWEEAIDWPKELRYVGATKTHGCPQCGFEVHCEVIEPYPHSNIPRVRVTFDTLMWIPHDERTSP